MDRDRFKQNNQQQQDYRVTDIRLRTMQSGYVPQQRADYSGMRKDHVRQPAVAHQMRSMQDYEQRAAQSMGVPDHQARGIPMAAAIGEPVRQPDSQTAPKRSGHRQSAPSLPQIPRAQYPQTPQRGGAKKHGHKNKPKNNRWRKVVAGATVIALGVLAYFLQVMGILPAKYLYAGFAVLALLAIGATAWLLKAQRKFNVVAAYGFALVLIGFSGFGAYTLQRGYSLLQQISGASGQTVEYSAVVLQASRFTSEQDIPGKELAAASADTMHFEKLQALTQAMSIREVASYPELVAELYGDGAEIVLLNEGYRMVIEELYAQFSKDTRVIATYKITEQSAGTADLFADGGNGSFNIYISGIDTYGDISRVSRSDVNIVASVNPNTKKMLLTTIPRDSYVSIAGGGNDQKDKLTHAGIYGVDSSIGTLENLLQTDIAAYVRVNFTSLVSLVDKIGGIEVVNPVAFRTDGGEEFPAGVIKLNGQRALTFSRERHNLAGGDTDRGQNQQRVIVGIFNKISSPALLANYQDILTALGKSIETNISTQDISRLVNMQLDYGGAWQIDSTNVTGRGQTGGLPSYAMPGRNLYMYVLDQASLDATKQRIQSTLSGE